MRGVQYGPQRVYKRRNSGTFISQVRVSFVTTYFLFINSKLFIIHDDKKYLTLRGRACKWRQFFAVQSSVQVKNDSIYYRARTRSILVFSIVIGEDFPRAPTTHVNRPHLATRVFPQPNAASSSRHSARDTFSIDTSNVHCVSSRGSFFFLLVASCFAKSARKYTFN